VDSWAAGFAQSAAAAIAQDLASTADMAATAPAGLDLQPGSWETLLHFRQWRGGTVLYAKALEVAVRPGYRPEIALAHLDLAELLLENYPEECADALDHLNFAVEEFPHDEDAAGAGTAPRYRDLLTRTFAFVGERDSEQSSSFADGRYEMWRLFGEGRQERVFLTLIHQPGEDLLVGGREPDRH
jgi:hypothetical protein